jgi:hypothetical protein
MKKPCLTLESLFTDLRTAVHLVRLSIHVIIAKHQYVSFITVPRDLVQVVGIVLVARVQMGDVLTSRRI